MGCRRGGDFLDGVRRRTSPVLRLFPRCGIPFFPCAFPSGFHANDRIQLAQHHLSARALGLTVPKPVFHASILEQDAAEALEFDGFITVVVSTWGGVVIEMSCWSDPVPLSRKVHNLGGFLKLLWFSDVFSEHAVLVL